MSKAWLKCARDFSRMAKHLTPTRAVAEGLVPLTGPPGAPVASVLLQAASKAFR